MFLIFVAACYLVLMIFLVLTVLSICGIIIGLLGYIEKYGPAAKTTANDIINGVKDDLKK